MTCEVPLEELTSGIPFDASPPNAVSGHMI